MGGSHPQRGYFVLIVPRLVSTPGRDKSGKLSDYFLTMLFFYPVPLAFFLNDLPLHSPFENDNYLYFVDTFLVSVRGSLPRK